MFLRLPYNNDDEVAPLGYTLINARLVDVTAW